MSNLHILTVEEQQAFDYPSPLPPEMRAICFVIDNVLEKELSRLRTPTNKVGFLLQYAYFKANKRFFFINRYRQEDIEYAAKLLGISINDVDLSCYKKRMPIEHQRKILTLLNYKPFDEKTYTWLKQEVTRQVAQQSKPKQVFIHALNLLVQNKIEIPSYHRLVELITLVYADFEDSLLIKLNNVLHEEDRMLLDNLLDEGDSKSLTLLNQLKVINQSTKPKAIQASLVLYNTVKDYFFKLKPVIDVLNLSPNSTTYYAIWVQKAKLSQLKQFPEKEKCYLHLLAFIQHQFYLRQDYLMDISLKSIQSSKNTVASKLSESDKLSRSERRKAVGYVTKSNRQYRCLIDEIRQITHSPTLSDKAKVREINELLTEYEKKKNELEQQKLEQFEKTLERLEKNKDYFDILDKISIKLQRKITDIIKVLIFNDDSSNKNLMSAIEHLIINDSQVKSNAPTGFLKDEEKEVLFDENKKLRTSLYKILLFMHVGDSIKSGEINLKYSYRYKAIHEYLVDKERWREIVIS